MILSFRRFIFSSFAIGLLFCFTAQEACCGRHSARDHGSLPHSTLTAESVLYLQKAISQIRSDHDLHDTAARIVPIITVTTGLLEAGVSSDEPLLQSSLRFLQRFYDDQKSLGHHATVSNDLLAKIKICLETSQQDVSKNRFLDHDVPDERYFLLNSLDTLGDSDAVDRAKKFVHKLNDCDEPEPGAVVVANDETRYVASQGLGRSIRIHDLGRTLAEPEMLPWVDGFSSAQFDSLIAAVCGLPSDPSLPKDSQFPNQESLVAVLSTIPRLNDNRKKTNTEPISVGFFETYRSLINAFEPRQSVLRKHLIADSLSALLTVRRLE